MSGQLTPPERLIVAVDIRPNTSRGCEGAIDDAFILADKLSGTNVFFKFNSLHRMRGHSLIKEIHARGLRFFADLKVYDIHETASIDGDFLSEFKPELLTTVCSIGVKAMKALKEKLPETEVLGVTVLTNLTEEEVRHIYGCSVEVATSKLAQLAEDAGLDGLITSPKEVAMLRAQVGNRMTLNTPAIRPHWAFVEGDDQNPDRARTPAEAIRLGADRVVIGRPITQAADPYAAVMRTLDEIAEAMAT